MSSSVSSLTASRSSSPEPPVQPDHFYGADPSHLPPSPDSEGKTYLSPDDDPLAHRGIPVFKPTMHEFADFEGYMNRVEAWGRRSGIIKVIPPKEWTNALPDVKPQLAGVKIKSPIEQFMRGRAGLFRQENMEKRKLMSVREWAELCAKDEFRAPGKDQVGVHNNPSAQPTTMRRRRKTKGKDEADATAEDEAKVENNAAMASPPNSASPDPEDTKPEDSKPRNRRVERADKDASFIDSFSPHTDWLPPGTTAADYTPEFCAKLERAFWRNCGLGKPPWYGADTMGSLYTDATAAWNVAHLQSTLSRLLPASSQGLPGVNTPYLYFGMWRATFAWHVEDMDLFSINYIHFGAPKFWYAVPQARAGALEDTMRGYFPKDTSTCPQFLRHKSFLASPTLLAQSAVRPNHLVQHAGEFVVTYPRGYHAGFNLGLNCAESVNFALDSWLDEGRKAAVCKCVDDSVRIDVDQLLEDRRIEALEKTDPAAAAAARAARDGLEHEYDDGAAMPSVEAEPYPEPLPTVILPPAKPRSPRKRKPTTHFDPDASPAAKRPRTVPAAPSASTSIFPAAPASASASAHAHTHAHAQFQKVTLKLGPPPSATAPPAEETYPCCLCVSPSLAGLVRVHDLPIAWREVAPAAQVHFREAPVHFPSAHTGAQGQRQPAWMAHESCARVLPETWVDEVAGERVVFGVDGIVRGRWNLKCNACTRTRAKAHGALIQCTKGKCPKSFHISCAEAGGPAGIAYSILREVEKEVVLLEPAPAPSAAADPTAPPPEPNLRVLKTIQKVEVEVLCPQHNPVIIASRRASKADGLRADILALPPLSRIKIRVSAGVFEVTLMRVLEERRSVEVLWDAGEVREFKWNSIILGATSLPTTTFPVATHSHATHPHATATFTSPYNPTHTQYPGAASASASASSSSGPRFPNGNIVNPSGSTTPAATSAQSHNPYAGLVVHPSGSAKSNPSPNPNAAPQTQTQNPYSVFKYEYWQYPGAASASSSGSTSAHSNANASNYTSASTGTGTSAHQPGSHSHYVNQYYTGPQPWSSQYYRGAAAAGQAYYPQVQFQVQPQPQATHGQQQQQAQAESAQYQAGTGTTHQHCVPNPNPTIPTPSAAPNPNPSPPSSTYTTPAPAPVAMQVDPQLA
ncbi:JmjC-domain-containing protein [Mycena galericulata]|nr:JmjC-domain-containing protein [Mycena galericulata]